MSDGVNKHEQAIQHSPLGDNARIYLDESWGMDYIAIVDGASVIYLKPQQFLRLLEWGNTYQQAIETKARLRYEQFLQEIRDLTSVPGSSEQEIESIKERIMAMAKTYTWEEKIESLVTLAKAAGDYINLPPNGEPGEIAHYNETRSKLREAYDAFCEWRHDEPYAIDEIKAALSAREHTMKPEALAELFHVTYERLAPSFGYETRKESAVPWNTVPEQNKQLMIAVSTHILQALNARQKDEEAPPIALSHPLCAYCGKMYKDPPSTDWYAHRINGQEWIFCSEQHLQWWTFHRKQVETC